MSKTFIIAEAACTWLHGGLEAAYRSIRAAKECGADAFKTQWTSNARSMAQARWSRMQLEARFQTVDQMAEKYQRLAWPEVWLPLLKAECDKVGIEFMCTAFLVGDFEILNRFTKRTKVSAFESKDKEFTWGVIDIDPAKDMVISSNLDHHSWRGGAIKSLYCVSEYPTTLERLGLHHLADFLMGTDDKPHRKYDGLSDHTTSTLTGAVAVGAGARIIEKHVRLSDTPSTDPDYGHSLQMDGTALFVTHRTFKQYVDNIREAERML